MTFASALVSGGSGFIGRTLVARLIEQGVKVACLGRPQSHLPAGAEAIRVAGFSLPDLTSALDGHRADVLFHLAAYGVAPTDRDPTSMFETNVQATANLLGLCPTLGCRALVYAGSCSEYATPAGADLIGEKHPLTHDSLYGASKAAAGLWGQALGASLGVSFQWLRLFGVYGPGEAPHRLLPSLATRLRRDEHVPLSPGEQKRDFLHVEDAARGLMLAAEAALEGQVGPFNLCSGKAVTVAAMARQVATLLGKPESLLEFGALPYRPGEPMWLVGNPAGFAQATGFRPEITLQEGLARALLQM